MDREQFKKGLQVACAHLQVPLYVLGSQVVHGQPEEREVPRAARASLELDLLSTNIEDEERVSEHLSVFFGQGSYFDEEFGFHLDGLGWDSCVLPEFWESRTHPVGIEAQGKTYRCLVGDIHDVAAAKLYANRDKDRAWFVALEEDGWFDWSTLSSVINELETFQRDRVVMSLGNMGFRLPPSGS